jgi:hypothetical protein
MTDTLEIEALLAQLAEAIDSHPFRSIPIMPHTAAIISKIALSRTMRAIRALQDENAVLAFRLWLRDDVEEKGIAVTASTSTSTLTFTYPDGEVENLPILLFGRGNSAEPSE